MPTCSFPTKKGAVVFNTASRAKCRPSATTGKHKLSQDHRKKAPAPAPRAAKRAAPRAAPAQPLALAQEHEEPLLDTDRDFTMSIS